MLVWKLKCEWLFIFVICLGIDFYSTLKLMRIITSLFFLILFNNCFSQKNSDYEIYSTIVDQTVLAVCEITKTDGTMVSGYMKIGAYKCDDQWMNGFCTYRLKHFSTADSVYNLNDEYFTLGFKSIELNEGLIITTRKQSRSVTSLRSELKYVLWKSKTSYELCDSVTIFHDFENFSTQSGSENKTTIAVQDISMLKFPEWKEIPNSIQKKIPKEPSGIIWYHDILNKED